MEHGPLVSPHRMAFLWLMAVAASAWAGEAPGRMAWPIPAMAWRVPIGRLDRGVPVGGFGAGSIMVNAEGSFGPWHFTPGKPEPERRLAAAAFHFFERQEGEAPRVTTLTARRLMPAWTPLPPNAGFYHALYPKGWFTYRCFAADVALKFFTPILRGNDKETSYPVAVFEFVVANPTDRQLDVGILFTFPNAAGHTAELRSGFLNVVETDREGKILAVVLDASYEHNHPASQDAEWCIAVRAEHGGEATYVPSWNAMASGGDVLREFADDGRLPNEALDATDSAAAVAFWAKLDKKEKITVPFVLSWDFPRVSVGGAHWWRRYTEYVGTTADRAFPLAAEALRRHAEWEAAIDAWQRPILADDDYPVWLRQAALNELYYNSFGGVFWEAGCITQPREFNNLEPGDHKYFTLAGATQPLCEPLALHAAAAPHLLALWPGIAREVVSTYADAILAAPGPAVHDLGSPSRSPILTFDAAPRPDAKDLPAQFILQAWAVYAATGDRAFLDHVWPACVKCVEPLLASRAYRDGLPRHGGQEDAAGSPCALHGISLLVGGLWAAAYEALERMAEARGDARAGEFGRLARQARATLDRRLWRPGLRYYAMDTHSRHSDALASGALAGLRYAQATGLSPVLPPERLQQHLHQVFGRCVRPFRDHTGDGVGDVGAINVMGSDRCPPGLGMCHEVWLADTYSLAATMYRVGKERSDEGLVAAALKTAYGPYFQTWEVRPDKPLWAFASPQAWHADNPARARGPQHMTPRAVWELLLAIKNPFPAKEE